MVRPLKTSPPRYRMELLAPVESRHIQNGLVVVVTPVPFRLPVMRMPPLPASKWVEPRPLMPVVVLQTRPGARLLGSALPARAICERPAPPVLPETKMCELLGAVAWMPVPASWPRKVTMPVGPMSGLLNWFGTHTASEGTPGMLLRPAALPSVDAMFTHEPSANAALEAVRART